MRAGPPSGQFDGEGRRAAAPRFEAQPVQGVSSIKPGATAGAWWALSDNGFGGKWNSSDYRLCIYLFDVRPRTEAGHAIRATRCRPSSSCPIPAKFFPVAPRRRELARAAAHRRSTPTRNRWSTMPDEYLLDRRRVRPVAAALLDRRRVVGAAGRIAGQRALGGSSAGASRTPTFRGSPHSRGLEAMDLAGDNKTLVSILEGTVAGDAAEDAARAALRHGRRKVAEPHSYI